MLLRRRISDHDVRAFSVADPLFVDRSAHDYRLSTLSLCRLVVGGDVGP